VSNQPFKAIKNEGYYGRGIIHPIEEKFLPNLDNLAWHRKEIFRIR
jgi:hypothetical protein